MHIGFITSEYPHSNFTGFSGGIGSFIKTISEQLVVNNLKVTVFIYSQKKNEVFIENGVEVHHIQKKKIKGFTFVFNRKHVNKYINKIVKKNKIDVLEAPDWTGFTAFMKFEIPLIIRLHGTDTYFCNLENREVKWKNKFFEKKALEQSDKVVGVSQFVSNKTKELFNLKKEISVIYNTINVENFTPDNPQIENKTILYFGTVIRKKGVLEIAKMFNILIEKDPEAQLIFLGKDSIDIIEKKSTLELVKNLFSKKAKENFKYVKSVPYNQIQDFINKAEVVVLPSFAEAFPMTWLEAMALEKKLVTSNIGWAKELMIDSKTGYMINPKNHEEFANRVLKLLTEENSNQMAKNARKRIIDNFNIEDSIKENIKLYQQLL